MSSLLLFWVHSTNEFKVSMYVTYDATEKNWFTNRQIDKKYEVRSHRFCIHQFPIKLDMRKFNFTNRVISVWNTLPDTVVSTNTIDTFKARLDRFWSDQEVKRYYNRKSKSS